MVDFDGALAANSLRFREVLSGVPATAPVPSCPDWTAGDLLWHLTQVQNFWATILDEGLQSDEQVGSVQAPERPADHGAAIALFDEVSRRLRATLAEVRDDTPVWTWTPNHTVGWVRRRQAQEALMHRVDAELAAGLSSRIGPELAEDGIDELLAQFGSESPDWGAFEPSGVLVEVRWEAGPARVVRLGRFRGVDPSGRGHDEPDYQPVTEPHDLADAVIEGSPAELLLWLWGRSEGAGITVTGEQSARVTLRGAIAANTR